MPAGYRVLIKHSAEKEIRAIDPPDRFRIVERIRRLSEDPRPAGCEKLSGRAAWRVRSGAYRIVYTIEDAVLTVHVARVGHRRDVYRR